MDGYNLSKEFLEEVEKISPKGNILEFGSGEGTIELLKTHNVISIEHEREYDIRRDKNHLIYLCPIEDGWYSNINLFSKMLKLVDLIIVDGPPRFLREGILKHLDIFKGVNCPIMFDDVHRELDRKVMEKFCEELNYDYEIHEGKLKSFGVCFKSGI